jgi:hypothetical protein
MFISEVGFAPTLTLSYSLPWLENSNVPLHSQFTDTSMFRANRKSTKEFEERWPIRTGNTNVSSTERLRNQCLCVNDYRFYLISFCFRTDVWTTSPMSTSHVTITHWGLGGMFPENLKASLLSVRRIMFLEQYFHNFSSRGNNFSYKKIWSNPRPNWDRYKGVKRQDVVKERMTPSHLKTVRRNAKNLLPCF